MCTFSCICALFRAQGWIVEIVALVTGPPSRHRLCTGTVRTEAKIPFVLDYGSMSDGIDEIGTTMSIGPELMTHDLMTMIVSNVATSFIEICLRRLDWGYLAISLAMRAVIVLAIGASLGIRIEVRAAQALVALPFVGFNHPSWNAEKSLPKKRGSTQATLVLKS